VDKLTSILIVTLMLVVGAWAADHFRLAGDIAEVKADYAKAGEQSIKKTVEEQGKAQEKVEVQQQEINKVDASYTQEKAKDEKDHINDIASVRISRVYIPAKCPVPADKAPDSGDDTRRSDDSKGAELEPEATETLKNITYDGDSAIKQLNALILACSAIQK